MEDPAPTGLLRIGELAERVNLSLRTVRYYDDAGLLEPAGRTAGGFRLYDARAIERLLVVKKMKPLGFSLDEMRALLLLRDELTSGEAGDARRRELHESLKTWIALAEEKLDTLNAQMQVAEDLVTSLRASTDTPPQAAGATTAATPTAQTRDRPPGR